MPLPVDIARDLIVGGRGGCWIDAAALIELGSKPEKVLKILELLLLD